MLEIQGLSSVYSGQSLQNIIERLENAVSSGKATGEFQVNNRSVIVTVFCDRIFLTLFHIYGERVE